MAKTKEWKVPKKKQPVWRFFKSIFALFFTAKSIVYEGEQLPNKCIIVSNHNNKKGPMVFEVNLPILFLVMMPCLFILSVAGDLAGSLIKRGLAVKDSGSLLPGIGGIFDLIDSPAFTVSFATMVMYLI